VEDANVNVDVMVDICTRAVPHRMHKMWFKYNNLIYNLCTTQQPF
jgi:hypothetical protein